MEAIFAVTEESAVLQTGSNNGQKQDNDSSSSFNHKIMIFFRKEKERF